MTNTKNSPQEKILFKLLGKWLRGKLLDKYPEILKGGARNSAKDAIVKT